MIRLYDAKGDVLPLTDYEDFCITHKLDGCDEMSFCLDVRHKQYPLLYEEAKIITDDNIWLIKKIDDDKIDCELDFDFLKQKVYTSYRSETRSLVEVLRSHLPNEWGIEGDYLPTIKRTIEFEFCTDFDVIYACMNIYKVYFVWKMKEKKLTVYSPENMKSTGEYLTSELNLTALSFKGDTTSFATRLYAFGADGMTMEDAMIEGKNGELVRYGKTYVENNEYSNKTVCAYWSDERYTVPESLYQDAKEKLDKLAYPVRSYECDAIDLAKRSEKYFFLDFQMHKKVTLIDNERGIKVEHQIVEYKEYPDESDRNKITLSCVPDTIQTSITNIVDSIAIEKEKISKNVDSRIADATESISKIKDGHAVMVDLEYSKETDKYYIGDGAPNTFVASLNPAVATPNEPTDWNSGRLIIMNHNGYAVSTSGIAGPYKDFAVYYDEEKGKYYQNADDIAVGTLQGIVIKGNTIEGNTIKGGTISGTTITGGSIKGSTIEIGTGFNVDINGKMKATGAEITGKVIVTSGEIGNFKIDNGDNTAYFPRGALYCDYDGEERHFRTIIKAAHFDEKVNTAAFTWTLSTQTYSTKENETTYRPTFILYADGIEEHYRNIYLADNSGLRVGTRQTSNNVADTSFNLLTFNESGNVIVGSGSQKGDTRIYCQENSEVRCCFGEEGSGRSFSFARRNTLFKAVGDTSNVMRYVMTTSGGLVISAGDGENALYLQASSVYALSNFRTTGDIIADGNINNVSIALESTSFPNIDTDNRRVIRTNTALVLSANSGSSALYLDASTTHIIYAFRAWGTLTVEGSATLKRDLTVNGDTTVSGTINGVSITRENFSATGVLAGMRRVIRASDSLVITANNGGYALYLQGSSVVSISNFSTLGTLTAEGNTTLKGTLTVTGTATLNGALTVNADSTIRGVTISYGSTYISGVDSSTANRYTVKSKGGFIVSANDGSNALYLQSSTTHNLGNLTLYGTAKFSSGEAITSDARLKNSIAYLADDSRYDTLINLLKPVSYKYNDGNSGRTHMGLIAQDLKKALETAGFTTDEIAAYVEFASDAEGLNGYECAIRYSELIPLIIVTLQKCLAKIF